MIPLTDPYVSPAAWDLLRDCMDRRAFAGDGILCGQAEEELRNMTEATDVLLTTSCTHALELATAMIDGEEGDEIILPSFTFTSTATAVVQAGFVPVFADVDPSTMNIDPDDVKRCITSRTRAIIPVHYAGVACDMDALQDVASNCGVALIEDAAHGLGGSWNGRALGTIGRMGAYSFHASKNFACGEGGAFTSADPSIIERAEIYREKGTNRKQFFRGNVDKYTWVGRGSSYVMADPLAALLLSSLRDRAIIQPHRQELVTRYRELLGDGEMSDIVTLPVIPGYATPAWHLMHIILGSEEHRDSLMNHLRSNGIGAAFHYIPLHTSPMGRNITASPRHLPATEDYAGRLLRLPLHTHMTVADVDRIVDRIGTWRMSVIGGSPVVQGAW